jgi:excisionase family DNA binding protein
MKGKNEMTQLSVGLAQAEEMTGLSQFTLRRLVKRGKVRAARVGRRILIPMTELERLTKPGANTESKTGEN